MFCCTQTAARRWLVATLAPLALIGLPTSSYALAPPITPSDTAWVPDGAVNQIVHRGDRTIVSGRFHWWGPHTGSAIRVATANATPGAASVPVNVYGGTVYSVIADGAGGAYLGGDFQRVNGKQVDGLAHIDAAGAVDAGFTPSVRGRVLTMALSGNTLYLGGSFTSLGSGLDAKQLSRAGLGAVNATTGVVSTAWTPCVGGGSPVDPDEEEVRALNVSGGTVFVGGAFQMLSTLNTTAGYCNETDLHPGLGSVSATTGAVTGWHPDPAGSVDALVVNGATVYAGGTFTSVQSNGSTIARTNAAAFTVSSSLTVATSWDPRPNAPLHAMTSGGNGDLFLGGDFTALGNPSTARRYVARVNGGAGAPTAFDAHLPVAPSTSESVVEALALSGSRLLLGSSVPSSDSPTLRMLDASTGAKAALALNPGGAVLTLAPLAGGVVLAGGAFSSRDAARFDGLAVLDELGIPTSTSLPAESEVGAFAVSPDGSTIFADVVRQPSTREFVRIDVASGTVTKLPTAPPPAGGTIVQVMQVSADGQTLYIGGDFPTLGGAPRKNVGAVSTSTGALLPWQPNPDGKVTAIRDLGGQVYLGGSFHHLGASPELREYLTRVSAATGAPDGWKPTLDGSVNGLDLTGDGRLLYATGGFQHVGAPSVARGFAAAFSTADAAPTAFDPHLGAVGSDLVLTQGDGVAYLSGYFEAAVETPGLAIARTVDSGLVDWSPVIHGNPSGAPVLDAAGNSVWVGSNDGATFGSTMRPFYAQYVRPEQPVVTPDPTPAPPVTTPAPTPLPTRPATKLTASAKAKAARFKRAKGSSITITLSAPAKVTITTARCPSLRGACKRPRRVRTQQPTLGAGTTRVAIGGKGHRLAAGRYTLTITAKAQDGRTASAKALTVVVTR